VRRAKRSRQVGFAAGAPAKPENRAARAPQRTYFSDIVPGSIQKLWQSGWIFAILLVAAVFAVYWPCIHGDWIWDDHPILLDNPVLQSGGLAKVWTPPGYLNFWPITYTVYRITFQLWNLTPLAFHLVNIALHAVAVLLVWRVLRRLQLPGALLAAAIFALHPVNVETIAWVGQLKGILSLVFALVSLLLFLGYERQGGRWRYAAALAAFAMSALSKGDALTLPIIFLALAWWQRGRIERRDVLRVLPFLLLAACFVGLEIWSQHLVGTPADRADGIFSRTAVAGSAVWFYLWKFICPFNLMPMYPRWQIPAHGIIAWLPDMLLLAAIAAAWHYRHSWGKPALVSIICYIALLLPVLGFVNIAFMKISLVADHWQYIAIIVPSAVLAAVVAIVARRYRCQGLAAVGCGAVLLALAMLSRQEGWLYEGPDSFFGAELARNPNCWAAEVNLGVLAADRGNPDEALRRYLRAVALNPDRAELQNDLGTAFLDRHEYRLAKPHFERALELDPNIKLANYNLAMVLGNSGDADAGISHLKREVEINPDFKPAHQVLAAAQANRKQVTNHLATMRESIEHTPNDPQFLEHAAWILATNPYESLRNGEEAVRLAERAWKITGGNDAVALNTLAAAYADADRFDEAITAAERAKSMTDNIGFDHLISACLKQYRSRQPFRDLR
jgi:tetratricopeptide (TPR) repeat protein